MHHREAERALLKRKLEHGISIHMPAPRRIGKTWTVNRLALDLRNDGWNAVEIDVEGIHTPEAFATELCRRIEGQISLKDRFTAQVTQRFNALLGRNTPGPILDALRHVDPISFAETLIGSLNETSEKSAIIVDEIAYFVLALAETNPTEVRSFAYKLRAFQQRFKKVRWLLTGSIGLDTIARRYDLQGAFVDFETFILEPFTPEEARSYLRDPNIRIQFTHIFDASDADYEAMFAELGWLAPYYLKLVANAVRPSSAGGGGRPPMATRADFEAALEKLLQPNRKAEFAIWREHVSKNLPAADRELARTMLGALCQGRDGENEATLIAAVASKQAQPDRRQIRDILDMLCNDGLIRKEAGRYRFQSGLVRRYWKEHEAE